MTVDLQGRQKGRMKLWLALAAVAAILVLLLVPPLVSLSRYKNRITQVIAASFGRPVRLSSVELRILPRPSFVLTDLNVEEDPAFGAEPILHANTVTASIWLLPLWRGRLEINRISVDEASLNLVRTGGSRWNLDSLLHSAATRPNAGATGPNVPFPYVEATSSRINIKNGVEKLPFSIVNADLSFWQDDPGVWRVRLRGQPARTDVSLDLPDTGILRLEASLRRVNASQQMPVHADLDWKDAQLGQLSRLLLGSDQGWRGDLNGELHIDGTADAATITSRLRASGVHRAEFAPASPIDFDATCNLLYHYSDRSVENLLCNSPIGDGRVRITGEMPARGASPHLTLEMDRVPAQVALDALRTVRNGLDSSLTASGSISGQISYAPVTAAAAPPSTPRANHPVPQPAKGQGPLSGGLILTGLRVSGNAFSKPIQIAKVTVEPAVGEPAALVSTIPILAGAPAPLVLAARLSLTGYQLGVRGNASLARLREMAQVAGLTPEKELDKLEGQSASVDLNAHGPWLSAIVPVSASTASSGGASPAAEQPLASPVYVLRSADQVNGIVTLRDSGWKSDFLANSVQISTATLHFENNLARWDPIAFTYGPVKGTATLFVPPTCDVPAPCPPQFALHFGTLDAAELQAALLGARQSGTLISNLIARLRPSAAPAWPSLQGSIHADSLQLTLVTLEDVSVAIRILPAAAEITSFDATLLGGLVHGAGSMTPGDKPAYTLKGTFNRLDPAQVGRLLGMNWSGGALEGTGEVAMSGFTDTDLAASAKGSLHFDWPKGSVASLNDTLPPPALARFDRWVADAAIADGAMTLRQNQVQHAGRKFAVEGSVSFGDPPAVKFSSSPEVRAAQR
jgi:hypothetical protein